VGVVGDVVDDAVYAAHVLDDACATAQKKSTVSVPARASFRLPIVRSATIVRFGLVIKIARQPGRKARKGDISMKIMGGTLANIALLVALTAGTALPRLGADAILQNEGGLIHNAIEIRRG
jgi:hypothetical protein